MKLVYRILNVKLDPRSTEIIVALLLSMVTIFGHHETFYRKEFVILRLILDYRMREFGLLSKSSLTLFEIYRASRSLQREPSQWRELGVNISAVHRIVFPSSQVTP